MTAAKPALIYFDMGGRADSIRLAFKIGGVEFEDRRLSPEEFGKLKPSLPFGQLPVLEIDGSKISQSMGILMYAGQRAGLIHDNDKLKLHMMELLFGCDDLMCKFVPSQKEADADKKKELCATLAKETIPFYLSSFEKLVAKNGKNGFCVGDCLSVADLQLWGIVAIFKSGRLEGVPTTICDSYTKIMEVYNKTILIPKVKEYLESQKTKAKGK